MKPHASNLDEATERALAAVATGTGIALAGRVTAAGLGYAFSVLIARWLGAEDLGLFSLAFTLCTAVTILGRFGLGETTVLRFVALYRGEAALGRAKGTMRFVLRTTLSSSIVLTLALLLVAPAIAVNAFGKPELAWVLRGLAWMVPPSNVAGVALAATQACGVMTYVALTTGIIAPLLQLIVATVLVGLGCGLSGAVIAAVAAQGAAAVLGYRFLGRVMLEFQDDGVPAEVESARLLRFAKSMIGLDLTSYLAGWIDILLLGAYVTAHDLGLYSAAARTAALTSFLLLGVNALFAPTMADLFNRGELAILERLFKTVTKWVVTIALPVFLLCALRGGAILALFGPEFRAAAASLAVLAAGQLVNAATGSVGYMLIMSGRQNLALADQIGGLCLALILSLWLIPRWGALGAAVAMGSTTAAVNLVRLIQVRVLIRLHPYDASFRQPLIAAAGALVAGLAAAAAAPAEGVAALGVPALAFAAAYAALLIALGFSREDRLVLGRLWTQMATLRTRGAAVR